MMRGKLEYGLLVNGPCVAFTVFWMDERCRNRNPSPSKNEFVASNGIRVVSAVLPEISRSVVDRRREIFLRGEDVSGDFKICQHVCDSGELAVEFAKEVHQALKEWSEGWEGFKEESLELSESAGVSGAFST